MDKKSKFLFGVFLFSVVLSIFATFYRYVIVEDIDYVLDEEVFQESLLEE